MRYLTTTFLVAAVAAVLAGCGGGGGDVPSGAVAEVSGTTITQQQFDALLAQAKRSYVTQKRKFPEAGTQEYQTLKNQAVQYLVQRVEFQQEADDLGIKVTDKEIDARLEQIKKQYFGGNDTRYKKQLAQQGLTEAQVREDIEAQLIQEKIFKKVTSNAKVTDAQIQKYYDDHQSQYGVPEQREVAHILVKKKALADALYTRIKAGEDFAKLAKQYSQDPGSKKLGGKLTISKGQTVGPFDQTVVPAANRRDLPPDQDRLRLPHHQGRRPRQGREDDAVHEGQGVDQTAAAPAEEERGDVDLVGQAEEGLQRQDLVPDRLRAAGHDDGRNNHDSIVARPRGRAGRPAGADPPLAARVSVGSRADDSDDRPAHGRGGVRGCGRGGGA